MNWYIKLFAPLIICFVFFLVFLYGAYTDTLNDIFSKEEYMIRLGAGLITWGVIHALVVPGKPYKYRYRILLILAVLIYPIFVFAATSRGSLSEEWTILLFLGAAVGLVSYFLRHRADSFSLAPKWEEIKYISTLASIGLGAVFTLVLLDEVLVRWVRLMRRVPEDWGVAFLVLWGITATAAMVSYYVEAILHYKRNSLSSWESRMDQLGKE